MTPRTSSDAPVFVVGAPRSGTTLMASLLSAHPRIAISPETHFFPLWVAEHGRAELSGLDDFQAFWARVVDSQRFSYLGVDENHVLERIRADEGPPRYRDVFQALLQEYASGLDKPRWGEKTPAHERHLHTLLDWFPGAGVVFMVRDPRAVAASLLGTPWGRGTVPELHARSWRQTMERAGAWRDDERVLFVRYEELVAEPEACLRRVCRLIGEAFDPAMLEDRSRETSPIVNREGWAEEHLEKALEPVTADRVGRWRSVLTPAQVARVEAVVRALMRDWGYEPATEPAGALTRGWWAVRRFWARGVRWLKDRAPARSQGEVG